MKTKMLSFVLAVCLLVCTVASCGHEHNWTDATCLAPKTCSECGETEGEALGHKWNDATCKSGKFCSACGITEGNVLDHTFVSEACSGCGLAASEYYDNALTAINDGEYAVAYKMLSVLGGYRDSADLIKYFRYVPTKHILAEDTFVEWSYNDKNLPIQIVTTYGVGIREVFGFTYGADGNLTKYTYISGDGDVESLEYTYDENRNLIKKVATHSNLTTTYDYTYDENGNLVKEVYKSSSGYQEVNEFAYKLVYFPHQMHSDFEEFVFSYLNFVED